MGTIEVQFRKLRGEVIAVFPYIVESKNTVLSYQHIGQHSECVWNINSFTKAAKPEEYQSLLSELKQIYNPDGVDFKVIQKRNHKKFLIEYYKN